jgi:F0F1-type ATP synthase assembly protein I
MVVMLIVVLLVMIVHMVEVGVNVVRGGIVNFVPECEDKCGCWHGVALTLSSCVS